MACTLYTVQTTHKQSQKCVAFIPEKEECCCMKYNVSADTKQLLSLHWFHNNVQQIM